MIIAGTSIFIDCLIASTAASLLAVVQVKIRDDRIRRSPNSLRRCRASAVDRVVATSHPHPSNKAAIASAPDGSFSINRILAPSNPPYRRSTS